MSHQSGIKPSQDLVDAFANAVLVDTVRALKVVIAEETLTVAETLPVAGSWEEDFATFRPWLQPSDPAFVIFRKDSKLPTGDYEWILLQYVPDHAKVRDKMLYASTKATLTKELGDSKFVDTLYGTTAGDLTLESYKKHLVHKDAEAPLTERELELQSLKRAESGADISTTSRRSHAQGVAFPISSSATESLEKLKSGSINVVVLCIDLNNESIELEREDSVTLADLPSVVRRDVPRFVFYAYNHVYDGEQFNSIVFSYVCPPSSKVKERMLYSSSRATVLAYVEETVGISVPKKIELDDMTELDETDLLDSLHPKKPELLTAKPAFARPARPGGRGPARVSRPGTPASTGGGGA
ncbi:Twinfilin-1 [Borealophlyctis nickersoniae]|nr:Twinfilin-1 [Borealophlyctis nickersoniae]